MEFGIFEICLLEIIEFYIVRRTLYVIYLHVAFGTCTHNTGVSLIPSMVKGIQGNQAIRQKRHVSPGQGGRRCKRRFFLFRYILRNVNFSSNKFCWITGAKINLLAFFYKFCNLKVR